MDRTLALIGRAGLTIVLYVLSTWKKIIELTKMNQHALRSNEGADLVNHTALF